MKNVILEDVEHTDAPPGSVMGLLCFDCHDSLLLSKVARADVEKAAELGRTPESADFFSKAMMEAYKNDPGQKRAITIFLVTHAGHFITPALMLETRGGLS